MSNSVTGWFMVEDATERYRVLYETVTDGIVFIDMNWRIVECNQAFAGMLGYSREELKHFAYLDLTPAQWRETDDNILKEQIMKRGYSDEYEKQYIRKDGTILQASLRGWLITDKDGLPKGMWAVIRETKQHKKAEEEIRVLSSVPRENPNPVFRMSKEGTILYSNPAGLIILAEWERQIGQVAPDQWCQLIHEALNSGVKREFEETYRDKTFSFVFAPVTDAGYVTIHGQDVTERKKVEESLRETRDYLENLIGYANAPIIVWDSGYKITRFNHAFERLTGLRAKEVLGKELGILFPEDSREKSLELIQRTVTGERWEVVEIPIWRKDGTVRMVLWNSATLFAKDGKTVVATIAQGQDITELKQRTKQLEDAERLAAIGQLASAVGHEIRNPLGVIKNSVYFLGLKLKDTDEKVTKHLRIMEKEVNSANLIVGDLLDFARRRPPVLQETDLNKILRTAAIDSLIPENIELVMKLSEMPQMLLDQEQLRRVFLNIILNAIQAMPEGGKMTIQTSRHDDSVRIGFTDTGVGIPKENMPKIFTPLFSTKAKGIGLGLTICKQIVEAHDGNITVKSKVGEGSTFTIELPIRLDEARRKPTLPIESPA